jgi:hypothetical protein
MLSVMLIVLLGSQWFVLSSHIMENNGDGTAASRALRAQRAWPFLIIVDRHAAAPPLLRAGRWRSQFSRRSLLWGLPGPAQRPI